MYKCNFPIDKLKAINTLCASVFTEYFISEGGFIYGTSNVNWCVRIGVLPDSSNSIIPMISNAIIPPSAMRSVLASAKKTMTYVSVADDGIDLYTFEEKLDNLFEDTNHLSESDFTDIKHTAFGVPRFTKEDGSETYKIAKDMLCRVGPYAALVDEKDLIPLDIDEIGNAFRSESIYTVVDENDPSNAVIIGKTIFNDFNKILNISWKPYVLDGEHSLAVFRAEYPDMALFTFVKFIKGII